MIVRVVSFLVATGLYFYIIHVRRMDIHHMDETWSNAGFKILPIIALIYAAFSTKALTAAHANYKQNITLGLVFSMLGDICLVWRFSLFEVGALFFAIAHWWYVRALGFKSLRWDVFLVLCIPAAIFTYFQIDGIRGSVWFRILCYIYMVTLFMMAWRASARIAGERTLGFLFAFMGAFFFVISDNVLAYDLLIRPVPYAAPVIMVTYYLAQFGFAMSVAYYSDGVDKKSH